MARLFFAIWPDEAATCRLAALSHELAAASGGRAVAPEKIHLTLAFLGEIDAGRAEAARWAASGVVASSFEVLLDRVGSFRGARVAWAGSAAPQPALVSFQARLATALAAADFVLEPRPFAPHLTLARRIARSIAPAAIEPIRWHARSLTLVASDLGTGRYAAVAAWDLR